ncbi:MAG: ATP-binding cassette domain-containing protein [Akkermansiaceae bacterium]
MERIPGLKRYVPAAPRGIDHVEALVDIFTSFLTLDAKVDRAEAEVALDLLRHAFPEADHRWLARRVHQALTQAAAFPKSNEVVLEALRNALDHDEKVSLGLQLYLLVTASGMTYESGSAFLKVMASLDSEDTGESILAEMQGEQVVQPLPFDKVSFSTSLGADVHLTAAENQRVEYGFQAYRSKGFVIIRNTSQEALLINGNNLREGQIMRLGDRQAISLPHCEITSEDITFFLNAARTEQRQTLYVSELDGQISLQREKSRQSKIILGFGLNVHVEALAETDIMLSSGQAIEPGTVYELAVQDELILKGGIHTSLETLRKQAMETGARFVIDASRKTSLVSNDPSAIKRGDILLSPGLARNVILEIKYDEHLAEGRLNVLSAEREVFVDGIAVHTSRKLLDGSLIRLSANQSVRCRFSEGLLDEETAVIRELSVENVGHHFATSKGQKVVLDNVSLTVKRGEMLCVMGPSGSGKSTLLSVLAGHLKPARGEVKMNGVSLYDERSLLAPFIASMPQEEALNPQLTVREHLTHASTIRRPHLSSIDHAKRVDSILAQLGLQPLARRRVGSPDDKKLSGGERSRLNLGLDLGSLAEIFLFDEPISGLSSKDSEHVAETLQSLSRDNIVIASLHRPGAGVLRLFQKVLILDQGGQVAFFGTPMEMNRYFYLAARELNVLTEHELRRYDSLDTTTDADFVFDVLEAPLHGLNGRQSGSARRFSAAFWQERFEGSQFVAELVNGEPPQSATDASSGLQEPAVPVRSQKQLRSEWIRLFTAHFNRSIISKFRNRGTIYSLLLEAPLLAFLIGFTLRASADGRYSFHSALHLPVYLFLMVTIGMFLGLTNSATEILRDAPLLRRERNCRSNIPLYVMGKFLSLAVLAILQCAVFTWVGAWMLDIHGMFLQHWSWMTLTALCGSALALLVSSMVKSERTALSAVPLLLVPQILLAGGLVSFDEMNRGMFSGADKARAAGAEPVPARMMPLRYAYEGVIVSQAMVNPFEKKRQNIQKEIDSLIVVSGDGVQVLKPSEKSRLDALKEALRRLMAAEAETPQEADRLARRIAHAGQSGNVENVLAIAPYPQDESIETEPVRDYFVNKRIDQLYSRSEIDRLDYRKEGERSVFLAEWKYWLGVKISTINACAMVMLICIFLCLAITTAILQVRKQSVS